LNNYKSMGKPKKSISQEWLLVKYQSSAAGNGRHVGKSTAVVSSK